MTTDTDEKKVVRTINVEPKWVDLCSLSDKGGLPAKYLMPACEIADTVRQAQKQGKSFVKFTFENGECNVEIE